METYKLLSGEQTSRHLEVRVRQDHDFVIFEFIGQGPMKALKWPPQGNKIEFTDNLWLSTVFEVFLQDEVGCPVGCRSKAEVGFRGLRHAQARVVDAREVEILLPGYHEGGQVGRVDGEEDQGEESPDVGHEAGGDALRAVHVDGGLEEHHPDQPHSAHQGEVALGMGKAHVVSLVMRSG